jgi:hypothetical protein
MALLTTRNSVPTTSARRSGRANARSRDSVTLACGLTGTFFSSSAFDTHLLYQQYQVSAHLPLLHFTPGRQSESKLHVPSGPFEHLPLLHLPTPQSESKLQLPPRAVAHLPLLHLTPPPQSESKLHVPSGPLAHLPLLHLPPPQSESKLQRPPSE